MNKFKMPKHLTVATFDLSCKMLELSQETEYYQKMPHETNQMTSHHQVFLALLQRYRLLRLINSKGYTSSSYPTEGSFSEDVVTVKVLTKI
jgi:hypothetical protein